MSVTATISDYYNGLSSKQQRSYLTGAIMVPVFIAAGLYAWHNLSEMYETFKILDDGRATELFSSVTDCSDYHPTDMCQQSWNIANGIANGFGTSMTYSSAWSCANKHMEYCDYHWDTDWVEDDEETGDGHWETREWWTPQILGWQCAAENLSVSVPLYHGSSPNTVARYDGKHFAIPAATLS